MSIKEILNELPKNLLLNDSMHVTVQLDDTKLLVDPQQMKQVLYNLIRNSVEAMDGLGRLSIYSVKKEQTYEIYIKDSGTGMDEATEKAVFNPFFTSKETGTGLGLTIVQRIIDDHHGKIEVFETSKNGTTFLITLPLQD
ncbi:sensor histidine kinase [Sutcliffiella cohnii]|uniref:sensor histidine kinase n=1 Tax=Sutcliffiella cohnii TaxID=33932 RepID=UPI002E217DD9|nr:ATP-binding protein [Sutcliffiella cohnii]